MTGRLEKMWVVTRAYSYSTLQDICFGVTPIELERQFKGGLRVDVDEVAFYLDEESAKADALARLALVKDTPAAKRVLLMARDLLHLTDEGRAELERLAREVLAE